MKSFAGQESLQQKYLSLREGTILHGRTEHKNFRVGGTNSAMGEIFVLIKEPDFIPINHVQPMERSSDFVTSCAMATFC